MTALIDGPTLKRRVEGKMRAAASEVEGLWGFARYEYGDMHGNGGRWRRLPEYAATHLRIRAYYVHTDSARVHRLAAVVGAMDGCESVEGIIGHAMLRNMVVAYFDRAVAAVPS